MTGKQPEPQGLISRLWRRARAAVQAPTNTTPPLGSSLGRAPVKLLENTSLRRSLSLGPRPSVEPPHVFDYQFARSPAVSAAPSISSYRQHVHQPHVSGTNEEDLEVIEEVDTPPRTSLDDTYRDFPREAGDLEEPADSDSVVRGARSAKGHNLSEAPQHDGAGLLVENTSSDQAKPSFSKSSTFSADALSEALRGADQQPPGPGEEEEFEAPTPLLSIRVTESLLPPVSTLPMGSPSMGGQLPSVPGQNDPFHFTPSTTLELTAEANVPVYYDTARATCSLNLVCYRSGAKGCDLQQIQCVLRSNFSTDESFRAATKSNKHLVHTDDEFFRDMQRLYKYKMCGFFRRYFSLKTLRAFRVLAVSS